MLLKDLLLQRKTNSKHAIYYRDKSITYKELIGEVQCNSCLISKVDVCSNHIGIYLPNSIDYVVAYFTITFLDKVIIPIGIYTKELEMKSTVSYCELGMIITNSQSIGKLKQYLEDYNGRVLLYDITCKKFYESGQGTVIITAGNTAASDENSTALLLHTSGTTNNPKRVMLSHKNLIINARSIIASLKLDENDKTLIALPMTLASANTSQLLTHIYLGASIVIMEGFFLPNLFFKLVQEQKVTNFTGVPFMMSEIAGFRNRHTYNLDSLKTVCFGGGSSTVHKIEQVLEAFPYIGLVHMYGQTEASTRITHLLPEDAFRKIGSVGKPIPGMEVVIVNENEDVVGIGETGELTVRGDNIMKGYFNRENESAKALKNGWLYTGDLAKMDEEGYIYIVGRKKNVIICGGLNIYPEEIEELLLGYPSVKEARVFGMANELMGEIPVAEVVLKEAASEVWKDEIMKYCFKNLVKYKLPREIRIVKSLPKTATGKLVRF